MSRILAADLIVGITVGPVALPLAMAFAISSGMSNILPSVDAALARAEEIRTAGSAPGWPEGVLILEDHALLSRLTTFPTLTEA